MVGKDFQKEIALACVGMSASSCLLFASWLYVGRVQYGLL